MTTSRPARIAITGTILAIAIIGIAQLLLHFSRSRLNELQSACEESEWAISANQLGAQVVCDPVVLMRLDSQPQGISASIIREYRRAWLIDGVYGPLAGIVLIVSAMPWLWHFTLHRVGEISAAISKRAQG